VPLVTPAAVFDGGQLDVQFEDASTGYVRQSVRIEAGGAVVVVPRLLRWYARISAARAGAGIRAHAARGRRGGRT